MMFLKRHFWNGHFGLKDHFRETSLVYMLVFSWIIYIVDSFYSLMFSEMSVLKGFIISFAISFYMQFILISFIFMSIILEYSPDHETFIIRIISILIQDIIIFGIVYAIVHYIL